MWIAWNTSQHFLCVSGTSVLWISSGGRRMANSLQAEMMRALSSSGRWIYLWKDSQLLPFELVGSRWKRGKGVEGLSLTMGQRTMLRTGLSTRWSGIKSEFLVSSDAWIICNMFNPGLIWMIYTTWPGPHAATTFSLAGTSTWSESDHQAKWLCTFLTFFTSSVDNTAIVTQVHKNKKVKNWKLNKLFT